MSVRYTTWGSSRVILGLLVMTWLTLIAVLTVIAWSVVYGGVLG